MPINFWILYISYIPTLNVNIIPTTSKTIMDIMRTKNRNQVYIKYTVTTAPYNILAKLVEIKNKMYL